MGRDKRNTFTSIKEKLGKKLARWKEKMLSKAGLEVLIKAVIQAIPTYTMSCFKLLDSLYEELTSMIRNFLVLAKRMMRRKLLGLVGTSYVSQSHAMAWVLRS